MVQAARTVVAEINPHMPRTLGESFIHVDQIDRAVMVDTPVIEYLHTAPGPVFEQIARYIASIIDDGSRKACENVSVHTEDGTTEVTMLFDRG